MGARLRLARNNAFACGSCLHSCAGQASIPADPHMARLAASSSASESTFEMGQAPLDDWSSSPVKECLTSSTPPTVATNSGLVADGTIVTGAALWNSMVEAGGTALSPVTGIGSSWLAAAKEPRFLASIPMIGSCPCTTRWDGCQWAWKGLRGCCPSVSLIILVSCGCSTGRDREPSYASDLRAPSLAPDTVLSSPANTSSSSALPMRPLPDFCGPPYPRGCSMYQGTSPCSTGPSSSSPAAEELPNAGIA